MITSIREWITPSVAVVVLLITLFGGAKSFVYQGDLDKVEKRIVEKIDNVQNTLDNHMNTNFENVDSRISQLDSKLEKLYRLLIEEKKK